MLQIWIIKLHCHCLKYDSHLPKKLFLFALIKSAFYFMLKTLLIFEIFKFLSWLFAYAEKRLDEITKVNFKICDVTDWTRNNCNTYIVQLSRQPDNKIWPNRGLTKYVVRWAIWCHLHNLKKVKYTYELVLLFEKLQASACNFTKSNTPPWVFFTLFKL